jgi:hypothetical protein
MTSATKDLIENDPEFVVDMARFAGGSLTERQVRKKYRFDDAAWEQLGAGDALVERIEAEKLRRVRDGSAARERAQQIFATAPNVLGEILHGEAVSPRVKIESARELRAISANAPEAAADRDRFIITINLGADTEHYNKSRAIDANDTDPDHIEAAALAAIATNNPKGGGSGQPL